MNRCVSVLLVLCLSVLGVAALFGCSSSGDSSSSGSSTGDDSSGGMMGGSGGAGGGSGGMMGGGADENAYASVGERIFLTGVGSDGQTIPHNTPRVAQGSPMMGGGGCASCHGADGRGGTISMMMGDTVDVPDIRYDSLIAAGFADATIRAAITSGTDEEGRPLDVAMPRWQMSATDLNATVDYLKTLSAH